MAYITPTNYKRAVNTGLSATPDKVTLFKSILGQLSDGHWENDPTKRKFWHNATIKVIDNSINIMVNAEPDYARSVPCHGYWSRSYEMFYPNPYYKMTDDQIKQFFGKALRTIINAQIRYARERGYLEQKAKPNPEFSMTFLGHSDPAVTYKLATTIRNILLECDK